MRSYPECKRTGTEFEGICAKQLRCREKSDIISKGLPSQSLLRGAGGRSGLERA